MSLQRRYSAAWALWLAAFLVVEGVAVFNRKAGDTLSEHVWLWFGVKAAPKSWLVWPLRLFLGWLAVHLGTGWI